LELAAAVDLFAQRAAAVDADFAVTVENRPTIEAICERLDRLPLALELCAVQVDLFAPAQILEQLRARPLDLLVGGAHDLPPQHRTLRHAIQRSHELLAEHERALFRRLGVFVGGWSLEAMEAVCSCQEDTDERSLVETLHALIGKSLVRTETPPTGERRLLMLETIREYAVERLEASGEAKRVQQRHAEYFLALGEEAALEQRGRQQRAWLQRLEREHDNLRAALVWSQKTECDDQLGLQLAAALSWFWYVRGHWSEGRRALETALVRTEHLKPMQARAQALLGEAAIMRLWIEPAALDEIAGLPGHVRQRVRRAVRNLQAEPRPSNSRALQIPDDMHIDQSEACRLRIGN
jgi:non-specific serine/threonine protein kinase